MSKTVDFLHDSKVFYLASVDNEKARVRPINSVIEYDGKIYFEISNKKEMYQQMLKNLNIAISGMADGLELQVKQ
ncbi:MAG: pyridoxamine 5'-phosphate oxidase family protein [Hespellia sp.]|nr:pyridoxamine 5'-phosphate oxidase family protein [Hespellia sp.]